MDAELLDQIENSGLKKKHIAKKIGVTPTYLYLCLTGSRNLSPVKKEKLMNLLAAVA